jgi:DeoR family transcriptional regulator, fructose operon transcriptional repressor
VTFTRRWRTRRCRQQIMFAAGALTASYGERTIMTALSVVCPAGINIERGLTEATPGAAAVSQVVVASGERVIALAGPESFGVSAFIQFASLDQIDSIAEAVCPSQAALQPFLERSIAITTGGTS